MGVASLLHVMEQSKKVGKESMNLEVVQETSYKVAELMTKVKNVPVAEILLVPACKEMAKTVLGRQDASEIF
jgi:uncharacterized protein YqhQ